MGKKRVRDMSQNASKVGPKVKTRKSKNVRQVKFGQVHIKATYNNTIVTFCDASGNVLATSSAGAIGYQGAKKATPYAASQIVENAYKKAKPYGLESVEVFVKGVGMGRDTAIRSLISHGLTIQSIRDVTPLPHGGPRPKKRRKP